MKMNMKKGNRLYIQVKSLEHLKDLLKKNNHSVRIVITKNLCLLKNTNYEQQENCNNAVFFDSYSIGSTGIYTATAKEIMVAERIDKNKDTVYYCERKEKRLIAEKIKNVIEYTEYLKIDTPFSIKIDNVSDAHFNQLIKMHPEIVTFFKEGNS